MMKVLVIGSGGREHALAWKLSQSEHVTQVFVAPGNGGTEIYQNIDIQATDLDGLLEFAREEAVDLTIVGPEDPLSHGIVDLFEAHGLMIFGPNKECAQFESSKQFTKDFLQKYHIPTARYQVFNDYEESRRGLTQFSYPVVIKADGLCQGKGVVICHSEAEALKVLEDMLVHDKFGQEGNIVVIEEFLQGRESSLLAFVSNNRIIPLENAEDHKQIYEGDQGPNTGGVGAYSPYKGNSAELDANIQQILSRIEEGFNQEQMTYNGILFIGFMIDQDQPKVLEFNVRFGDPETEVLLPRLDSDLYSIITKCIQGDLSAEDIRWRDEVCLATILCSEGYPDQYEKGKVISGLDQLDDEIILFHNGTKYEQDRFTTNGGRVLTVATLAPSIQEAREIVYQNIERIYFDGMYYRRDIGLR